MIFTVIFFISKIIILVFLVDSLNEEQKMFFDEHIKSRQKKTDMELLEAKVEIYDQKQEIEELCVKCDDLEKQIANLTIERKLTDKQKGNIQNIFNNTIVFYRRSNNC